jgi:hypothetical protein
VFSALLVLSDASSFFLFCLRALCCLGLFYVGLFSVRTFFLFFKSISVYTAENPPPDNSGQIMQINSPPWLRGQAHWEAGKKKLVLVLSGDANVRAGPGG